MGKKHVSARVKNRIKQQIARSISIMEKRFSHSEKRFNRSGEAFSERKNKE